METIRETHPATAVVDRLDDTALVELARRGDEGAVRALVQHHNRRLFRVARGIVRDDAEAEDIVQETYVRAFTNLDAFRGDSRLGTWLTRIAINEALGRLRRRRPRAELAELEAAGADAARVIPFPSPPPADPEAEAGRAEVRRLLEQCIDALPAPLRLVVILRDVEGLSTEATAAALGIRPETAKTRLHRGRRRMRAALVARLAGSFSDLFPFDGAPCAGMADRVVRRVLPERPRLADEPGGPT
jgi:RNA polymerase sigma-70 factor, ECF subfamily